MIELVEGTASTTCIVERGSTDFMLSPGTKLRIKDGSDIILDYQNNMPSFVTISVEIKHSPQN
ncbi:MAG: hypothetical protein ACYSWP_15895 [Planctomycetota bacterium]|jgi:hypothetical protein